MGLKYVMLLATAKCITNTFHERTFISAEVNDA